MQEATENLVIKILLDNNTITQEDYNILFSSKEDWYILDGEGKQDWSLSDEQQIVFWESIKKVEDFFENMPQDLRRPTIYDFSFIKFPQLHIIDGCIISPNELLFKFSDNCSSAIFNKAKFYGEVIITNSKFKIDLDFRECIFKDKFSLNKSTVQNVDFSNAIFLNNVLIENITFQKRTKFTNSTFKELLDLNKVIFQDEVNLQINSIKESTFKRLTFEDTARFGGAHFNGKTSFLNCSFKGFTEFTKATFHKEGQVSFSNINFDKVYFLKTKFLAPVAFLFSKADLFAMKDVVITKITLNHTFFKDADIIDLYALPTLQEAKLEIIPLSKDNIKDRETARTLKLLFDKRSNIPDSNNLFSIEQEFYTEELRNNTKPPSPHKWNSLSALYLNKIVSNFGTDWIRPLLVMFIFGFFASIGYGILQDINDPIYFKSTTIMSWLGFGFVFSVLLYISYHTKNRIALWFGIIGYLFIIFTEPDFRYIINDISKLINPLNIFKSKDYFDHIAPYGMLVKLIMSVLIYQFIMAFRQNTRRK